MNNNYSSVSDLTSVRCLAKFSLFVSFVSPTEGEAVSFVLGDTSSPVRVGVPFSIPLNFKDEFDYLTQPSFDIKPQLECR